MSLTDEQIRQICVNECGGYEQARAVESAATAPLLERIAELERELEAVRKDAERYRFIRDANRSSCIDSEIATYAMESLDEYVDAAMEDEQRIDAAKGHRSE